MQISQDKKSAIKHILRWYAQKTSTQQFLTLGGYAGTGKTTLIAVLRKILREQNPKLRVAFAAFTGKAAQVLQNYLRDSKLIYKEDSIGTIHSLIYRIVENEHKEIVGWKRKEQLKADLIVIDEASMVDKGIWLDLCAFGVPILAVGDHGQLPPVHGQFNLMEHPELELQEIHRQLIDHPIIKVSVMARTTGKIAPGNYGSGVRKLAKHDPDSQEIIENYLQNYQRETLILCGYNTTRTRLNTYVRSMLGFESSDPQAGDRVICLRNKPQKALFNGMLGTIERVRIKDDLFFEMSIQLDDREQLFDGLVLRDQFGSTSKIVAPTLTKQAEVFDFAYALTVHKAQGSQATRVILFEERFKQMSDLDWRRWLYTAVTRAEDELIIVGE